MYDVGGSLSTAGREQSAALAHALAGERIAHVWTSPMARAVQTAEIVAAGLGVGVTVREALHEVSVGDFAGMPPEPDPIRPIVEQWAAGDMDRRIPGAESGREVADRMAAALDAIADASRGEAALVVSHGAAMCTGLPTLVANFAMERLAGRNLPNTGVVHLERDADGWRLLSWPGVEL